MIRFDQFLARLPAGVQLFSLFYDNPPLLALLAEIMAAAPRLAEEFARRPALLDLVLTAEFFDPLPRLDELAADFARAPPAPALRGLLDLARRWVGERKFQVGVQLLRRLLMAMRPARALADIAEAALAALLPALPSRFRRRHGRVAGGALAVIGLGKLGSREMTLASDLDLILIYDAPATAGHRTGRARCRSPPITRGLASV